MLSQDEKQQIIDRGEDIVEYQLELDLIKLLCDRLGLVFSLLDASCSLARLVALRQRLERVARSLQLGSNNG